MDAFVNIDARILETIQKVFANPFFDAVLPVFTGFGDIGQIWIVLGIVLLFFKKTRRSGFLLLISLLLTHLLNNMLIKKLVMRPRPYVSWPFIRLLVPALNDTSFPSGHTATAFGSVMILVFRHKGLLRWLPLAGALLMAFSRLYVGAHYPSDVAAGALVGTLTAAAVFAADRLWAKKRGFRLEQKTP